MHRRHPANDQEDASRAQLLLIGSLIITFALVVLVLLLNNVLFVQNVESEGISSQAVEVGESRQLIERSVGEVLIRTNAGEFDGDTATYVEDNVSQMMGLISNHSKAEHGTSVSLVGLGTTEGTIVRQTDGGNFSNYTEGTGDWHLAETEDDVRRFQFNVTRSSLNDYSTLTDPSLLRPSAFYVNVSDGSDWWHLFIYESTTTGELVVSSAQRGDLTAEVHYQEPVETAEVALTTGRVEGEKSFEFAPNVDPPYDIRFVNGEAAKGNYTMTFNQSTASTTTVNSTNVDTSGTTSPYALEAVYAVNLTIEQTSVRSTYEGDLLIAPCQPGNDTCQRDISITDGRIGSGTGTNPGSNDPVPAIDDAQTPNSNKVEVDWSATDDVNLEGGTDNEVQLVGDGNVEATIDISPLQGTSDSGSVQFNGIDSDEYSNWEVVVVVTDSDGNTNSTSQGVTFP